MEQILLITYDPEFNTQLLQIRNESVNIFISTDQTIIYEKMKKNCCNLVLLDFDLIVLEGFSFLCDLIAVNTSIPILMISRTQNPCFVVESIKAGAVDFIHYPCSISFLRRKMHKLIQLYNRQEPDKCIYPGFEALIGDSEEIQKVKQLLSLYSDTSEPILILGESGTGKNIAAQLIHKNSMRSKGPYCRVNIAAIPDTLIESELFGTSVGAYTGAINHAGYFESTHGGTLFLDEIGEMPILLQTKMLQALECGEIRRLGSGKTSPVDLRFVFATNRNLREEIKLGNFRKDLYYRISVLIIEMPSLSFRKDDIPALANHFLSADGRNLSPAALDKLLQYSWPGNTRELRNCISRATILCRDKIIDAKNIIFDP